MIDSPFRTEAPTSMDEASSTDMAQTAGPKMTFREGTDGVRSEAADDASAVPGADAMAAEPPGDAATGDSNDTDFFVVFFVVVAGLSIRETEAADSAFFFAAGLAAGVGAGDEGTAGSSSVVVVVAVFTVVTVLPISACTSLFHFW